MRCAPCAISEGEVRPVKSMNTHKIAAIIIGTGIKPYMKISIVGLKVAKAPIKPKIAPDAPMAGTKALFAVIIYPTLPRTPDTKKIMI